MSKPITFNWPAADTQAVCIAQPMGVAGELVINGTLATKDDSVERVATFLGTERTVSITSAGDLSGVVFTVTGTLRGRVVSESLAGPDTTPITVYTTQKFTTVTSVSVDGALIANASIGTGLEGSTIWFLSDYHRTFNSLTVSVSVMAGAVDYTFETTLDDPSVVALPTLWEPIDGVTVLTVPTATPMILASTSALANYVFPTHSSRIKINTSDAAAALKIVFLQQGIT